jgi:hypothetical protein
MANRNKSEIGARQLTPRQVEFAKHLLESDTITEAARRAGYSDKNLAQSGHQALKAIRLKMPELMDALGLSEKALIEKHLVPLLSATSTKFFQHEGRVTQKREVADNDARLKALDMAFKLRGSCKAADSKLTEPEPVRHTTIVIDVPRPGRPVNPVGDPQEPSRP